MDLETRAFHWLRFEKQCPIVLFERSPRIHWGRPDVLGVSKDRFLMEIEVKRSMSDFRANREKIHVANRNHILKRWPRLYWFLVPRGLVDKVTPELPDYAGLLTEPSCLTTFDIELVRKAKPNPDSKRLSIKETVRMVELQSNQMWSHVRNLAAARDQLQVDPSEYQI
jgi:hypothetical protein